MKHSWVANGVAVSLGLAVLLLVEGGLQVLQVGPSNRLFVEDRKGGREVYRLNSRAARRFFPHQYVRLAPGQEVFAREKPAGTFRIFVLGASTLLGFPNPPYTSFPNFLRLMLEDAYPQVRFEVINCGITAINSFCILDFVEEVADYEPDLLLIYAGHNEFVGPYGVTTPFVRFGNDWRWIRFHMLLQRAKIYYWLEELLYYLQREGQERRGGDHFGLHLVRKEVYLESEEHRIAAENYRRNLQEIMRLAQQRGVPVLLSTLVSNLRGFYPLRSQGPPPPLGEAETGGTQEQVDHWDAILEEFPHHAAAHFEAGEVYYQAQEFSRARRAFVQARDLDTIHFRACSPFNQIIRDMAAEAAGHAVFLVDMEEVFAQSSPHGIAGDELIADYLHPTVSGHFLMAREMAQAVVQNQEALGLAGGDGRRLAGLADYCRRLGYSARDRVYSRNDLILFLRDMPYGERPGILRARLAELISLQLAELLELSYGEIQEFARRGGFYFLAQTIDLADPTDQVRLRAQLEELTGPLRIDPYAKQDQGN